MGRLVIQPRRNGKATAAQRILATQQLHNIASHPSHAIVDDPAVKLLNFDSVYGVPLMYKRIPYLVNLICQHWKWVTK